MELLTFGEMLPTKYFCASFHFSVIAEVVELVDTLDSKSSALKKRVGSIPTFGTHLLHAGL